MPRFRYVFAAGVALAAVGFAAPASAVIITATYAGTVSSSRDLTGIFGLGTGDGVLDDAAFEAVFTFDTMMLGYFADGGYYQNLYGGEPYPTASPGSAVLTINGTSAAIGGDYFSNAHARNDDAPGGPGGGYSQAYHFHKTSSATHRRTLTTTSKPPSTTISRRYRRRSPSRIATHRARTTPCSARFIIMNMTPASVRFSSTHLPASTRLS